MRNLECFALFLFTATALLHHASGGRIENAILRDTKKYVKTYKAMLDKDTYYIVEQPEVNDTVGNVFEGAVHAAFRFRNFFIKTDFYPGLDYRGVEKDRSDFLSYIADFLNSTHAALKSLCIPFGSENCGFIPDSLHYEMASSMKTLVENITQQTDRIRKELDGGSFVASYNQISAIGHHCDAFVPMATNYWLHTKINRSQPLESLVARGCDTAAGNPHSTNDSIRLRQDLAEYAKSHDLGGGEDNRCLQVFAARYTGNSRDAVEMFKEALGKYVLMTGSCIFYMFITIKGFCYYFSNEGAWTSPLPSAVNETLELVLNVRDGMELLDEFPLNDTSPWTFPTLRSDMKQAAEGALDKVKGKLDSKIWVDREELHQEIVHNTVQRNHMLTNQTRYVFNALAYLPYTRDDQHCRLFLSDNYVDVGYRNVNFFVFYANKISKKFSESAWNDTKDKTDARDAVLNHVFAKSNDDLCGRLSAALMDNGVAKEDFGGVAAVKCGYEFVWYELGYTYFYAAYSSTKYRWETTGGAYDAECGQIFFFP